MKMKMTKTYWIVEISKLTIDNKLRFSFRLYEKKYNSK